MSIEVEVLSEVYTILKQYIPVKDRQEAADNLLSVIVEMMGDQEIREFGSTDSNLKKALKQYVDTDEGYDDYNEYE